MGQYYVIALKEEGSSELEFVEPVLGFKMMEHAYTKDDVTLTVFQHLWNNPCHVGWIGDYACTSYTYDTFRKKYVPSELKLLSDCQYLADSKERQEFVMTAYTQYYVDRDELEEPIAIKRSTATLLKEPIEDIVIVNKTKKQYIDMLHYTRMFTHKDGWCVNPLAILCDASQEDAGGDYKGMNLFLSGYWIGDVVYTTDRKKFLDSQTNHIRSRSAFTDFDKYKSGIYQEVLIGFTPGYRRADEEDLPIINNTSN